MTDSPSRVRPPCPRLPALTLCGSADVAESPVRIQHMLADTTQGDEVQSGDRSSVGLMLVARVV